MVSPSGDQGSKIYVLSSEPKEHKSFCPGTWPGRPVTRVTEKSFMCKHFMCLFPIEAWNLGSAGNCAGMSRNLGVFKKPNGTACESEKN